MILPEGKFGAILADPPWAFRTYSKARTTPHRCVADHYETMSLDELAALPVADTAARDCALFMWVVDSHLDVALGLAAAWGFAYKTIAFWWLKGDGFNFFLDDVTQQIGMGYWTRKSVEPCLLFTRGHPTRLDAGVRQVMVEPRREHSRKPDEVAARIQRLVAGPYLELFARESRPGWTTWGDEVSKFDKPIEATT